MDNFDCDFKNPARELGIYPIVHDMGRGSCADSSEYRKRVDRTLERISSLGYGGVVFNIHYSFDFPEDKEAWENAAYAARKAEQLGLKLWIYDEKGYPSGSAGGAVLEKHPEYVAKGLAFYYYWMTQSGPMKYKLDAPFGKLFGAYLIPEDPSKELIYVTHTANEQGTLKFDIPEGRYNIAMLVERELYDGTVSTQAWCPPRRYINPLDKRAVDEFLNATHQNYYNYMSESFGSSVKAFFMDEPMMVSYTTNLTYPMVSYRDDFPQKFKERYGYDIDKALIAVFAGKGGDVTKMRCDFWDFIADEYSRSFFGTIQDWCGEHRVCSSGHFMGEEDVLSYTGSYGSFYRCMKHLDIPGIDQLRSVPTELMERKSMPHARFVASVADVFGRKEVMSEASDHFTRVSRVQVPMDWIRASMNWHFAMGVNVITSYYGLYHKDYFKDNEIVELNDYVKRLSFVLRKGERLAEAAILLPECSLWDTVVPKVGANAKQSEKAQQIAKTLVDASWGLIDCQIEFDYIDENVVKEAKISGSMMEFNNRRYKLLILPSIHVMSRDTAQRIREFAEAGGQVVCIGTIPQKTREGKDDSTVRDVFKQINSNIIYGDAGDPRIFTEISGSITRDVVLVHSGSNNAVSPGILAHIRKDNDRKYIFLCNMEGAPYKGTLVIDGAAGIEAYDPLTGGKSDIATVKEGNTLKAEVKLKPYAGMIYSVQ